MNDQGEGPPPGKQPVDSDRLATLIQSLVSGVIQNKIFASLALWQKDVEKAK